jgi:hypothetical protein
MAVGASFPVVMAIAVVVCSILHLYNMSTQFFSRTVLPAIRLHKHHKYTELTLAFRALIDEDGGGQWPPKTDHENWPHPLQPYKTIYLELNLLLSTDQPSTDEKVNQIRRSSYQSEMRRLLAECIDIKQVEKLLQQVESNNWDGFHKNCYHGFYCCISMLRHAYRLVTIAYNRKEMDFSLKLLIRWGTNPVVKVAQMDKFITFPPELDAPWRYLQRHFGLTSDGGNLTSNFFYNIDQHGALVYEVNRASSEIIRNSEQNFVRIFYDTEVKVGF